MKLDRNIWNLEGLDRTIQSAREDPDRNVWSAWEVYKKYDGDNSE